MEPKRIIWTCDFCGKEFSREVKEVLSDDGERVEVLVELLPTDDESPLCDCLKEATDEIETVLE